MHPASLPPRFSSRTLPDRDRVASLALVVLLHLLLLLLLLRFVPEAEPLKETRGPLTIDLIAEPSPTADRTKAQERQDEQEQAVEEAKKVETIPVPPVELPAEPASSIWSQVIPMTREDLAAADKAIRSSPKAAPSGAEQGESRTASSGVTDDSAGPGTGPNGETLYNARWEREPTNAELNTYLPAGRRRPGWGIIACRTVAGNRVEDCHEIAQSTGSGLAGAIRRAAWQFRILPPRIGGRPMIGEWVRIRIDYSVSEAK